MVDSLYKIARGWDGSQSIPTEPNKLRILIPAAPRCHIIINTWGHAHPPDPSFAIGCLLKYSKRCPVIGSNLTQVIS